jgi:hypothetical protein
MNVRRRKQEDEPEEPKQPWYREILIAVLIELGTELVRWLVETLRSWIERRKEEREMSKITNLIGADKNALLLILANILQPGTDWKAVLVNEGLEEVKRRLQGVWEKRVTPAELSAIATKMQGEGWNWEAATDPAFQSKQKVELSESDRSLYGDKLAGFVMSRDALYSILRETGVPGGDICDGWRDTLDNSVWEQIMPGIDAQTPIPEIVLRTFTATVQTVL